MKLQPVVPNIWHAEQAIKFGPLTIKTRMTVVKLSDGSIWVHSPIEPTPELIAEINNIGAVRYIVAPNKSHHLFFSAFSEHFQNANAYIASGLEAKRPDLKKYTILDESTSQTWNPDLLGFFVYGIPALNETVWFHAATETLIVTDLLFYFGKDNHFIGRTIATLLGVQEKMRMSRTMKLLVKDRNALSQTISKLRTLNIQRVILAHDTIVDKNVKHELIQAFSWVD